MAILNFTISPDALGKLHDALVCLGKFSDAVSIEAVSDKLVLTALNSSKSAYASFALIGNFFTKYQYRGASGQGREKFNCKIYNKALLSAFKGRAVDPTREKDTAVERCDVSVEDGEGATKSRFVIKIMCRHGVLKTYRLTFESVAPTHALFVKEYARNSWSISSKTLRELVEHFGPGTEQLDIYSDEGKVSLTSYAEKIISGSEILKQPLHTTIAIDALEFGEFSVEEKLHIVISVKDFKSIVTHAGISNTIVKALYSGSASPMQITYSDEGVLTEFILMTMGESRGGSATPASNAARAASKRPDVREPLDATSSSRKTTSYEMPPPTGAATSIRRDPAKPKASRPSPPPPQPSLQSDALFFPEADDDRRWEPVNYDDEEDEMLLWDAGGNNARIVPANSSGTNILQGTTKMNSAQRLQGRSNQSQSVNGLARASARDGEDTHLITTQHLAPTQRISEVKGLGLFD